MWRKKELKNDPRCRIIQLGLQMCWSRTDLLRFWTTLLKPPVSIDHPIAIVWTINPRARRKKRNNRKQLLPRFFRRVQQLPLKESGVILLLEPVLHLFLMAMVSSLWEQAQNGNQSALDRSERRHVASLCGIFLIPGFTAPPRQAWISLPAT